MRIISNFREFINKSRHVKHGRIYGILFHYIYLRVKYGIGVNDYFNNNLFNKSENHNKYFSSLHTYIHSWRNVSKTYAQNKSKKWLLFHWVDYILSKLYCPGVDAMDYFRYEWYRLRISARMEFITEGGLKRIITGFNGSKEAIDRIGQFSNKASFNLLFHDFINRKWFINTDIDIDTFISNTLDMRDIICKPISGGGGKGIITKQVTTKEIANDLFFHLQHEVYIIEEIIKQHDTLYKICPASVNTIRVYSVMTNNGPIIVGAALRIGNGESCTDNYSAGGLVAEIDIESGLIISRAVSQYGLSTYIHPKTKTPIIGTIIPLWENVKDMVLKAHSRIPEIGYIGWDTVVCNDGTIAFIEGNTNAGVELQQHAPLIGKKKLYYNILKSMRK